MKNENHKSKKMLLTLLIGGAVTAGVIYCIQRSCNRKTPILKKLGRAVSEIGEKLEDSEIAENSPSSSAVFNSLAEWVDTGLTLWKKFKKE